MSDKTMEMMTSPCSCSDAAPELIKRLPSSSWWPGTPGQLQAVHCRQVTVKNASTESRPGEGSARGKVVGDVASSRLCCVQWVQTVMEEPLPSGDFGDVLKDGVVLCKLMNKLQPGSVKKFKEKVCDIFLLLF